MAVLLWLDSTDSTNAEASRRFAELDNLSVIAARRQTAGRGQGEHSWHSEDGQNLTFSIVLRYAPGALPAAGEQAVSCLATLGIRNYLLSRGVSSRIKWPNDIWVDERKICGILIEHRVTNAFVDSSIIGIGINLNQTAWPQDLPNPVSLKQLTGKSYSPEAELEALYNEICRLEPLTVSEDGRNQLQEEFGKYVFRLP